MSEPVDSAVDEHHAEGLPASEITLESVVAIDPAVGVLVLDEETLLLDPETGGTHLLDGIGTLVVACLDGVSTLRDIVSDLADAFAADTDQVGSDVLDLMRVLGGFGLLAGIRRDEHAGHDHAAHPHAQEPAGLPVGASLADFSGQRGNGDEFTTSSLRGRRALLINWGTRCGYCTKITEELHDLLDPLGEAGVSLWLVTAGTADEVAAQIGAVDLPVLFVEHPPEFFQGLGTPAAYLIDADGTVSESLAVGALNVPALARQLVKPA